MTRPEDISSEVYIDGERISVLEPVDSSHDVVKMKIPMQPARSKVSEMFMADVFFELRVGVIAFDRCLVSQMGYGNKGRWIDVEITKTASAA